MNIKRSFRRCMADVDMKQKEVATKIRVSETLLSSWVNSEHLSTKNIERLAKVFGLSVSEFIALGE